MTDWRLIVSPPMPASSNMAVDEAILEAGLKPTLRFYSWTSPSVSIGYFQQIDDDFLKTCSRYGVPVVRRPTGGRAILHHLEITYSVVCPYDLFPGPTTLSGIYQQLALWLVDSIGALGINAELGERRAYNRPYQKSESCFMTSTPYEIHVVGKKICGSAQKRGKTAFLQHGSLLVHVDMDLMQRILGRESRHEDTFTTLRREGYEGTLDDALQIMTDSFSHRMGVALKEGPLTDSETALVDSLIGESYGDLTASMDQDHHVSQ